MKNGENKFTEETFISEGMEASGETFSAEDISSEDIAAENTEAEENGKSEGKVFAFGKKLEKGTTAYEIFDWLRTICIGVLAGIFIVVFLVQRDNVSGDSMVPTLNSGDVVFAQKISTYVKNYKRGDIVILDGSDMEGYNSKEYLVKRIVALPGETVRIADGNVYIKPADAADFFLLCSDP